MIRDATSPRILPAAPEPGSRWTGFAQGVRSAVTEAARGFDIGQGFIRLTLALAAIVAIVGLIGGGIWWAATTSTNQAAMDKKLDRVLEIQETVGSNSTAIKSLEADLAAEQYRNEALLQWVIATRLKLAERGFETPDLPSGTLKR